MPGIVNIGNSYDNSSKKNVGKLSFEVGETFSARVEDTNESGSEIILKLPDGWKFPAQLSKPLEDTPQGILKFQVIGMEDGKIQIQLVNDGQNHKSKIDSSIEEIIRTLGLEGGEDEYNLLMSMAKHDMPLTKENIANLKTILDFKNKAKDNNGKTEEFIDRYLSSKGLSPYSEEGKQITAKLQRFFEKLKSISENELMTLIENGVELTGENIESFNKIFKGEGVIYKQLQQVKEGLNSSRVQDFQAFMLNEKNSTKFSTGDNRLTAKNNLNINNQTFEAAMKINIPLADKITGFINNEDLIKQADGKASSEEIAEYNEEGNVASRQERGSKLGEGSSKLQEVNIKQQDNEQASNIVIKFKDILKANNSIGDKLINNYLNSKGIDVKSYQAREAAAVLDKFLNELKGGNLDKGIEIIRNSAVIDKSVFAKSITNFTEASNNTSINVHSDNEIMRALIRNRIPLTQDNIEELKAMMDFKDKLNDDNFMESFVKKLTVEKNIDARDLKSNKFGETLTGILKEIQQYSADDMASFTKEVRGKNNLGSEGVLENKKDDVIEIKSEVFKEVLKETINSGSKNFKLPNSADEVKQQISLKMDDMKQIVKELIKGIDNNFGASDKVLAMIQDNVGDFKVFNNISNNYYYIDVPVNLYNNDYQCKLIIKDDRRSGKKIDSQNVKIAASVKTVNMGVVDAYIKVLNRNVKIDIKCDEKWMRALDTFKEIIQNKISDMSYNVNIDIIKKENELNIVECREFFGNDDFISINTLV
ncbi:MAG: hypothetical protein Q8936_20330 [Bacillota bacterium]|nr:hypothetical protein [Bacillota bacterium]